MERALNILNAVALSAEGLSLTSVTKEVQLATSTVARLLKTLEKMSFVHRDSAGLYHAGLSVLRIGANAVGQFDLDRVSREHLRELADFTGETAYLSLPEGHGQAIYIRQVESSRAIRHATWTGRTIEIEGTALGAALTQKVTSGGYAISRETTIEPDAAAVAAPIIDQDGVAVATLSIIGPSFRLTDKLLNEYGHRIYHHACQISELLCLSNT